jgi:DNA-3-methyladenine glycosylase
MPLDGVDVMSSRRGAHPDSDKRIQNKTVGYEKHLCNGPGKIGEALGLNLSFDGASLLQQPFELKPRDVAIAELLCGPRINITKAVDIAWRWGHGQFRQYLSKPFKD